MKKARPLSQFLFALSGPIFWFLHFSGIYLAEALICVPPVQSSRIMLGITVTLTLLSLAAMGVIMKRSALGIRQLVNFHDQRDADFLSYLSVALTVLSVLGVLWVSVPTLMLPVCAVTIG